MSKIIEIQILKNKEVIKTLKCVESELQRTFHKAQAVAGGMWNGTDKFTISIK